MTEDYFSSVTDFASSPDREGRMSSNERRLRTLRNLAMSNASKARRRKRKQAGDAARRLTEAERKMREQARILEEREMRRELSEQNRQHAAAEQRAADEARAAKRRPILTATDSNDINIDIPTGDKPEKTKKTASSPNPKKKKKTKKQNSQTESRTAKGGRYSSSESSTGTYQNRITAGGAVTLGILTGVLIGTVIYGRVQTNEIYTKIAALQTEYDDLTAKNISMRSEMEGKMTVKNIEDYAKDELKLQPLNQSQITYIQLQTEDEVVITEPEDNLFVRINDKLVSIWEYLRGK
ncbi:MAG: hypothetical protein IKI77_07110 [Oscillospiraceae bacterium]|nr:hypothetical protein [Oscillospiraceae bacterium]